jgi:cytochrome P450
MPEAETATDTSFDPVALAQMDDPFPVVNELRGGCPVAHSDQHDGFWVLTRHEDVTTVAKDPQRFSSAKGITIPHHGYPITLPPIEEDPPRHQQFRGPIKSRFGPAAILRREDEVLNEITLLIDDFIERGAADLAAELTIPLPAIMAMRILGLREEDKMKMRDWAARILSVREDIEVVQETFAYFAEVYRDRQQNPRDDIPTLMLGIEVEGRTITEVEYLCMMSVLFAAGLDTTAHMASHAIVFLAESPEHRARLAADHDLLPDAVTELLRYVSPLPGLCRTTTEEVTIGGRTIPTGQRVMLSWMGANHDPEQFADPETVDFSRSTKDHCAFGYGDHQCLGRNLARVELRLILREILTRMPDFQLDPTKPIVRSGGVTRAIDSLNVTFTPGPRIG